MFGGRLTFKSVQLGIVPTELAIALPSMYRCTHLDGDSYKSPAVAVMGDNALNIRSATFCTGLTMRDLLGVTLNRKYTLNTTSLATHMALSHDKCYTLTLRLRQ